MSESFEGSENDDKPLSRTGSNWRIFILLSLGIVIGLFGILVYRIATDAPPAPPDRPVASTEGDGDIPPDEVDPAAVREEAWQRIQPRLKTADVKTRELTNQLILRIEAFFDGRKDGAKDFAEASLGWKSKWELIKSREGHRAFIEARFSEYIFTQDELATLLKQASEEYEQGLKAIENDLLIKVRADCEDLPVSALPAFANQKVLEDHYVKTVAEVLADIVHELQIDLGGDIGTFVASETIAAVVTKTLTTLATRMGISAAILTTGAATSAATFGAGIVIAIGAEFLLDWIIGWFNDPEGDIADKVTESLDEVKRTIIMGDAEAVRAHGLIKEMAAEHSDPGMRSKASRVQANIERGGALGLKFMLGRVADVQSKSRELILKKLVFEEQQQ